jgi:hypothetical protein
MNLNQEQQRALSDMIKFYHAPFNSERPFFTLTGGPGTGKTFMLKYFVQYLKTHNVSLAAAAISHSAKNVLTTQLGNTTSYFTVAQLLNMKLKEDGTGDFEIIQTKSPKFALYRVIIIDEVSMIQDELFDIIIQMANKFHTKLIAVGDKHQLPPVKQTHDSKFFDSIDAELIKSMRFGHEIGTLVKNLEEQIDIISTDGAFDNRIITTVTQRRDHINKDGVGYKFFRSLDDVLDEAVPMLKKGSNNINDVRMLAYKNESIKDINNQVRLRLFNENTVVPFMHDELLISNKNYLYSFGTPAIHNGEIMRVKTHTHSVDEHGVPIIRLQFKNKFESWYHNIKVIDFEHPNGHAIYNDIVQDLRKKALKDRTQWEAYYRFIAEYGDFDYGYAVNVYKAQGQTIKNTYVFEDEILGVQPLNWKQKFQALYVAATRASHRLGLFYK